MSNKTTRKSTRFVGVTQRESLERKAAGRPDVCYEIDFRAKDGRRVRRTIGWRSQGVTAQYAAKIREECIAGERADLLPDSAPKAMTFAEAFAKFSAEWTAGRERQAREDETLYRLHLPTLAERCLDSITAQDLMAISTAMRAGGLSEQTVRHALGLVRRVLRKMRQWKLYAGDDPFLDYKMPRPANQRVRYLTPGDARRLIDELAAHSPRMHAMALISLQCGLRFSEIARLTRADIDFAAQSIILRDTKSGRIRHAVMTPDVAEIIRAQGKGEGGSLLFPARDGRVMTQATSAFDRAVERLGLNAGVTDRRQRVVFHTLRHTYASWLAMSGEGQAMIADLLGHASLEMSRRYTHLMPDARRATAAVIEKMMHD